MVRVVNTEQYRMGVALKNIGFLIFLISFQLLATSCSYKIDKDAATPSANTITSAPEAVISYSLVKTDSTAVCLKCHNSGGQAPDLSTQKGMIENMGAVLSEVGSDDMPLSAPPLTKCQKAILQKWYDLGSPDESTTTLKTIPECAS